ncbi:multiple organellar RNA editing factor [Rhynchospora pubera]|uniref:Multiple organellar RNA editing factor n=1 Tax=Rhynchospora pubera TaxID=906938 RepID=A0AAV8HML3_9POAL|nr:multiple organellar RNA editing factor [Rhynchospora pubera]
MALTLSRHLRRAIPLSFSLLRPLPPTIPARAPPSRSPNSLLQSLGFRSSPHLLGYRSESRGGESKISPDEILFEGCDYNHWLITMDFPEPKPSPEEMVETYVQTCAKVVGSVEEAKKRIYACSTTTYNGFQVEVSEQMSEKFRGLPGVVFILPDSYLYPETKEYGGDKYDNGVITPRPPPIQYSNQNRPRNTVRFERNRPYSNPVAQQQQGNFHNNPPPQAGNFQNNPPQQRGNFQNYPPQQRGNFENYPQQQRYEPGSSSNYPHQQGQQPDYAQQQRPQPGNFQNYPQQRGSYQNYPQQPGNFQNYPQGPRQGYGAPGVRDGGYQRDFEQGQRGNYGPREHTNFSRGSLPDYGMGSTGYSYGEPAQVHQGPWKERQ